MNIRQIQLVNEIPNLLSEIETLKKDVLELQKAINAFNERINAIPKRGRPKRESVDAIRRQDQGDMRPGAK